MRAKPFVVIATGAAAIGYLSSCTCNGCSEEKTYSTVDVVDGIDCDTAAETTTTPPTGTADTSGDTGA